jgi:hypothetical protein
VARTGAAVRTGVRHTGDSAGPSWVARLIYAMNRPRKDTHERATEVIRWIWAW